MKKKPLSKTNPYLRDSQSRLHSTVTTVGSSSAIEGIHIPYRYENAEDWAVSSTKDSKKAKPRDGSK
jgi:hypothetical protein